MKGKGEGRREKAPELRCLGWGPFPASRGEGCNVEKPAPSDAHTATVQM